MCRVISYDGDRVRALRCPPVYGALARFYARWERVLYSPAAWLEAPTPVRVVYGLLSSGVPEAHTTRAILTLRTFGPELEGVTPRDVLDLPDVTVGLQSWASVAADRDIGTLPRDLGISGWDRDPADLDRLVEAYERRLAEAVDYADALPPAASESCWWVYVDGGIRIRCPVSRAVRRRARGATP